MYQRVMLYYQHQIENPFEQICTYEQQNGFYKCDTYGSDQDMVHILYQEENRQSWVSAHVLPNGQALITSRKYSSSPCPPSGEWLGGSTLKCDNPAVDTCFNMSTDRSQSCPRNARCFNTLKSFECDQEPETALGCDHIQIR